GAQQWTYAGVEDLESQEIIVGPGWGELLRGCARAGTDCQAGGGLAARGGGGVQPAGGLAGGPCTRPGCARFVLALCDMAAAVDKTADVGGAGAVGRLIGRPQGRLGGVGQGGRGAGAVGFGSARVHSLDCSGPAAAAGRVVE